MTEDIRERAIVAMVKAFDRLESANGNSDRMYDALTAAGLIVVPRDDVEAAVDAMVYVGEYFWEKWKYQEIYDRLNAALADTKDGYEL